MGRALARIEQKGIPTYSITRQGFRGVVNNCFLAFGFSHDASQTEFPSNMFVPGSDLTPLEQSIDQIVFGLTKWEPKARPRRGGEPPKKVVVEGTDYADALEKMNALFLKNSWSDGLPLLPATEEKVSWILTGTDLPRESVVGNILPSGRTATVEALAVCLAMTGGRPEYLPVLIAACKAFCDPRFRHQMMQATTCGVNVAGIVNGPIAKQIRINAGYGCLGPNPRWPASGPIGRAMRLMQQNIGSAVPESGTMSNFGGPSKWANTIFAEDEDGLPEGWEPLSVERGFAPGSNVITLHAIASAVNISSIHASNEQTANETLHYFARIMGSDYANILLNYYENSAPGILLMPRGIAQGIIDAGYTKETIKQFLWEHSKFPWEVVTSDSDVFRRAKGTLLQYVDEGEPWPISIKPEQLMIVVCGGKQSGHGFWMRMGCCPMQPISMEIELPSNWDELIAKSIEDMGPLPEL